MSGFKVVHFLSLGADVCNSARGFMFSLGCIQALKCNTNRCPSGIATQDEALMYGLDPEEKTVRVFNFQSKTVKTACEIVGAIGLGSIGELNPQYIMRRVSANQALTLDEIFPRIEPGCLLKGTGPRKIQQLWDIV
jgi:glutamate synthase domain-containing protein 2